MELECLKHYNALKWCHVYIISSQLLRKFNILKIATSFCFILQCSAAVGYLCVICKCLKHKWSNDQKRCSVTCNLISSCCLISPFWEILLYKDVNVYIKISLYMFKPTAVLQKLIVKHLPLLSFTMIWVCIQGRI